MSYQSQGRKEEIPSGLHACIHVPYNNGVFRPLVYEPDRQRIANRSENYTVLIQTWQGSVVQPRNFFRTDVRPPTGAEYPIPTKCPFEIRKAVLIIQRWFGSSDLR